MPGVSVSQVARRFDVNADMVFEWLRDPRIRLPEDGASRFLPMEIAAPSPPPMITASLSDAKIEMTLANGPRQREPAMEPNRMLDDLWRKMLSLE